jgi:hypothetical protein
MSDVLTMSLKSYMLTRYVDGHMERILTEIQHANDKVYKNLIWSEFLYKKIEVTISLIPKVSLTGVVYQG